MEHIRVTSDKRLFDLEMKIRRWRAMIKYINKKNPNYKRGTSYPEQFIYRCLVQVLDVRNRIKDTETQMEYDIEIKEVNLRIEYSGEYWHRNSEEKDANKKVLCAERGIDYLEIIELASRHETVVKEQSGYTQIIIGSESNFLKRNAKLISIVMFILKRYGYSIEDVDIERAIYEALACSKQFKYDIIKSEDNLILGTVNKEFQYDMSKGNKTGAILVSNNPDKAKDYSDYNAEDYKEFILEEPDDIDNLRNNKVKIKSLRLNMENPFSINELGEEIKEEKRPEYRNMSDVDFMRHCRRATTVSNW